MAKPLGPKSLLIREAITAHPGKGITKSAAVFNDVPERMDYKIKVKAQDVAQQRQAMKVAAKAEPAEPPPPRPRASRSGRPAHFYPSMAGARAANHLLGVRARAGPGILEAVDEKHVAPPAHRAAHEGAREQGR